MIDYLLKAIVLSFYYQLFQKT